MPLLSPVLTHSQGVASKSSVCYEKHYAANSPKSNTSEQSGVENLSAASNIAANGEVLDTALGQRMPDSFNADKWFDDSNQNASGKINVGFIDSNQANKFHVDLLIAC